MIDICFPRRNPGAELKARSWVVRRFETIYWGAKVTAKWPPQLNVCVFLSFVDLFVHFRTRAPRTYLCIPITTLYLFFVTLPDVWLLICCYSEWCFSRHEPWAWASALVNRVLRRKTTSWSYCYDRFHNRKPLGYFLLKANVTLSLDIKWFGHFRQMQIAQGSCVLACVGVAGWPPVARVRNPKELSFRVLVDTSGFDQTHDSNDAIRRKVVLHPQGRSFRVGWHSNDSDYSYLAGWG